MRQKIMLARVLACVLALGVTGVTGHAQTERDRERERDRAVTMAKDALATTQKVTLNAIRLVSAEAVDWPDSSLGCPSRDMAYMQVITPGYRVRLAIGEREHEVHTGAGRAVMCQPGPRTEPSSRQDVTPALAAADRAKRQLAERLKVAPETLRVAQLRQWRHTDRVCDAPEGTVASADTFYVELVGDGKSYLYRATRDVAWMCK